MSQSGANTVITLNASDTVTLTNVTMSSLNSSSSTSHLKTGGDYATVNGAKGARVGDQRLSPRWPPATEAARGDRLADLGEARRRTRLSDWWNGRRPGGRRRDLLHVGERGPKSVDPLERRAIGIGNGAQWAYRSSSPRSSRGRRVVRIPMMAVETEREDRQPDVARIRRNGRSSRPQHQPEGRGDEFRASCRRCATSRRKGGELRAMGRFRHLVRAAGRHDAVRRQYGDHAECERHRHLDQCGGVKPERVAVPFCLMERLAGNFGLCRSRRSRSGRPGSHHCATRRAALRHSGQTCGLPGLTEASIRSRSCAAGRAWPWAGSVSAPRLRGLR